MQDSSFHADNHAVPRCNQKANWTKYVVDLRRELLVWNVINSQVNKYLNKHVLLILHLFFSCHEIKVLSRETWIVFCNRRDLFVQQMLAIRHETRNY